MELMSFRQFQVIEDQLEQILKAITNLQEWNKGIRTAEDYLTSPEGTKTLAANCMLIEAIGEGFRRIDSETNSELLINRPEIPWKQVIGMRNRIAHGYFDINVDFVWDIVQNDLQPLYEATSYLKDHLNEIVSLEEDS
ncbi:MAG: DUF86 domain-containing protein [Bacteroidaceae bacterium]|nr:DUF86 domain-containing protein [Bacteroidaceae bacterium]